MYGELRHLSDRELLGRLGRIAAHERKTTAVLVAHLGEVERRGLHRDEGYSSLFEYCVQVLKLSESAAYARIHAARVARSYPLALELMQRRALHLTAINLLGPRLTPDNHAELLGAAATKSKKQVEALLAERFPSPSVPSVLRKLPSRAQAPEPEPASAPQLDLAPRPARPAARPARPPVTRPTPAPRLQPLAPERFKLQLTAHRELHDKLQTARRLMRHQVPDGDLGTILERALELLIERRMKQHFARTDRPRAGQKPKQGSRHIPHETRREVAERDGMRCTYVGEAGHRCEARERLEFHHEQPHARGGPPTKDNIRLLCQAHNQLLAERDFGPLFMARKRTPARPSCRV